MHPGLVLTVAGIYFAVLLLVALRVERNVESAQTVSKNPIVYTLALAVYCTSWTFYGSVGVAANSGLLFLAIYLGPTLMIILWWWSMRRMIQVRTRHRITSIADFISLRYDHSQAVVALASIMSLVGIVPYIALQLKAVTNSLNLLIAQDLVIDDGVAGIFFSMSMVAYVINFLSLYSKRIELNACYQ